MQREKDFLSVIGSPSPTLLSLFKLFLLMSPRFQRRQDPK